MGMRDLLASAVRGNSLLRLLALTLILSGPAFADPGTEMGVDDDLSIFGVAGTASDPDVEIKGFTVFGSTQTGYTGSVAGAGNVVVNGVLSVSSGAYFVGNSTFTSANKIFINDGSAGQILRKNSGGWLDWDSISSLGDNLGSHVATTTLQMGAYGVNTSSNITAARYQINGSTVLAILPGTGSLGLGVDAGRINTGGYNIFAGAGAGRANTTGQANSFLGYAAGYNNTTGGGTFVGYGAGYTQTTGLENTFVGTGAGYYSSTGWDNSFFGHGTGEAHTTGWDNTFVGALAGRFNQTGSANSVVGSWAAGGAGSQYSFSSSTLMGYKAGYALRTGSDNILLGFQAGYALTTGARNIIIGYDQGASGPAASNELNIGGAIYGDLLTKTVGINRTVQQAALDVVSTGTASNVMSQIWRAGTGTIVSSVSATGVLMAAKFIGDGSALTGIAGASGPSIDVSTINATATTPYGGVNITTNTFVQGKLTINGGASRISNTVGDISIEPTGSNLNVTKNINVAAGQNLGFEGAAGDSYIKYNGGYLSVYAEGVEVARFKP